MKCFKTKELLSKYIEGVLNPEQIKGLKEHLSECEKCSRDFASLLSVSDVLSSLEPLQAPNNFLEGVHARIQQRSKFKKALTFLFVPARIKIPLECASVIVAILIVLSIREPKRNFQIARAPIPSKDHIYKEEEYPDLPPSALPSSVTHAEDENGLDEGTKSKTIVVALLLNIPTTEGDEGSSIMRIKEDKSPFTEPLKEQGRYTTRDRAGLRTVDREKAMEQKKALGPDTLLKKHKIIVQGDAMEQAGAIGKGEASQQHRAMAQFDTMGQDEAMDEEEEVDHDDAMEQSDSVCQDEAVYKGETQAVLLNKGIVKIISSVEKLKGRYLSTEYNKQTQRPEAVLVDVPSEHYTTFIRELGLLGTIQGPLQPAEHLQREIIKVRIKLL